MNLHPKQGKVFLSDAKVTLAASGIQGGKTSVGAFWSIRQSTKCKKDDHAIIAAPTYKILNQSTLPTFLKYAASFGTYKKADQEFHFKNGLIAYIRTGTDPFSVEGIQDVRWVWLDEAGKCKSAFWTNLEGRAARTNAPILCTTTPYALNWPYTELIRPLKRGERDDVAYYSWPSVDNPSFPLEHYERQRSLLDSVTFAMKYGGEHQKKVGLIHPLDDSFIVEPYKLPESTQYYAGLDWGFTNPMALVIRGITPEGQDIQVSEFYESGVYPDEISFIIKKKVDLYGIKMIVADPADPGKIAMLQKYGLPVMAGNNDIPAGLDAHNQIIRAGRYRIFKTCKHTIDEYETYSWKESDDEDKDTKEEPIKKKNHAMDANRYLSKYFMDTGKVIFNRPSVHHTEQAARPTASPKTYVPNWKRQKERHREEL